MNSHQIRCFYKIVMKDGQMRLVELPMKRIRVSTGVMGHVFWLVAGKPIVALQRTNEYYRHHVYSKTNYSLTPEALAFIAREIVTELRKKGLKVKSPSWRNIHNDEMVSYTQKNKEIEDASRRK